MSKFFFLLSTVTFLTIVILLLFDVNTTSCLEPYTFSPLDAIGVLSMFIVWWGLGFLNGVVYQTDKEN